MKKLIFFFTAALIVLTMGCQKDLKVEGPAIGDGPVVITLTTPAASEAISSGSIYAFTGNISAPAGLKSAYLHIFGTTYDLSASGSDIDFSVDVTVPENLQTGVTYDYTIEAVDFADQEKVYTGSITLSQGLNGFIITPIAGITKALLSGLSGQFKMRLNTAQVPQSIVIKIVWDAANIQEVPINLASTDEFRKDTSAAKDSYLVDKKVTIPAATNAGTYDYSFVITTSAETIELAQKVEVQKISELYVLGDATTAGWDINNPIAFTNLGPNLFNKSIILNASPKGCKFVLTPGSWDVNWGTSETSPITTGTEYELVPGGNNVMVADSGFYTITVDFSTNKFKIEAFSPPNTLFLVGGSTPAGWDPGLAAPFNKLSVGVFEIYTPLTTAGFGFKFLPEQGSWNGDWGMKPGEPGKLVQEGEENCTVTEDGFYLLVVDFNTLTFTLTKTDWGIIGSAIPPYNWTEDVNMTYVGGAEPYTWEIANYTVAAGEFKFRANDAWTINFGDDGTNLSLERNGANIPVTAGVHTFKMILAPGGNYTYTVSAKKK